MIYFKLIVFILSIGIILFLKNETRLILVMPLIGIAIFFILIFIVVFIDISIISQKDIDISYLKAIILSLTFIIGLIGLLYGYIELFIREEYEIPIFIMTSGLGSILITQKIIKDEEIIK